MLKLSLSNHIQFIMYHAAYSSPFVCSYNLPEPSGAELDELKEKRRHMSRFVQELLLSTLTSSSSSSSSDSSMGNSDEEADSHKQSPV